MSPAKVSIIVVPRSDDSEPVTTPSTIRCTMSSGLLSLNAPTSSPISCYSARTTSPTPTWPDRSRDDAAPVGPPVAIVLIGVVARRTRRCGGAPSDHYSSSDV